MNDGGPRTRDQKAYLIELSQRRRHVAATVADLANIRTHENDIKAGLRASEQRVTTLSRKLTRSRTLLREVERQREKQQQQQQQHCRHRSNSNNNNRRRNGLEYSTNAHQREEEEERRREEEHQQQRRGREEIQLKSCVRLLEMDVDDAMTKVVQEQRALAEVTRRAKDIQDDLQRQWKVFRQRRDRRRQQGLRAEHAEQQEDEENREEEEEEEDGEMEGKVDEKGRPVLACAICLEEIVREKGDALALPCGHVFHEECVTAWLQRKQKCPTCQMHITWHA